jgi:hypothetical protein
MGLRYISVGDVLESAWYQIKAKRICQGISLARFIGVHYSTQNARTDPPRCWERIPPTFLCLAWSCLPVTSSIRALREFYRRTNPPINRILTFIIVTRTFYIGWPENKFTMHIFVGRDSSVGITTTLRTRRSGDRIPAEARFSAPVQTGPGAHPASYTMSTESFPGG